MTRILSQLLGAKEPEFRLGVNDLERASGGAAQDIRLTTDVLSLARAKVDELGLDPDDTTAEELYQSLIEKLKGSDQELARVLGLDPSSPSLLNDFAAAFRKVVGRREAFTLKSAALKRLLSVNPPKRAAKALGYRSMNSMLKRESSASLLSAALITESSTWRKSLVEGYKKLTTADFEVRPVKLEVFDSACWGKLSSGFTAQRGYNLIEAKAVSTIAFLSLPDYQPGILTTLFLLTTEAFNDCLALGSYLELHQVKADFGEIAARAMSGAVELEGPIKGQKLSWRTFHDFLTRSPDREKLDIGFARQSAGDGPFLIRPEDLLASLSPGLEFWRGNGHLAALSGGEIVSLNPLDVALNYLNKLPFERRVTHHFRSDLWQVFWQRYLQVDRLAERLTADWQRELEPPELALEPALAEEF